MIDLFVYHAEVVFIRCDSYPLKDRDFGAPQARPSNAQTIRSWALRLDTFVTTSSAAWPTVVTDLGRCRTPLSSRCTLQAHRFQRNAERSTMARDENSLGASSLPDEAEALRAETGETIVVSPQSERFRRHYRTTQPRTAKEFQQRSACRRKQRRRSDKGPPGPRQSMRSAGTWSPRSLTRRMTRSELAPVT